MIAARSRAAPPEVPARCADACAEAVANSPAGFAAFVRAGAGRRVDRVRLPGARVD